MAEGKIGPGPGGRMMGERPKLENPGKLLRRVLGLLLRRYPAHLVLVAAGIVAAAVCNVQASLFLRGLIDDYITPMLSQPVPDYAPLAAALVKIAAVYAVGLLSTWGYNLIMAFVTQGTLRDMRARLFSHMETLPIRYFDSHAHGDIMSVYTNDVDTLRQLISQALPQLFSSSMTVVMVFVSMVIMSLPLTLITLAMLAVVLFVSGRLSKGSAKYFVSQQQDLGRVNGYIEEMMGGQKVIKVFTHEGKALEGFRALNDALRVSADTANKFANMMMPATAQLNNFSYALCAMAGALMAAAGFGGVTVGTLVSFLALNRSFGMPIMQVTMQANNVIMALAGAERIFRLLDEEAESDEGKTVLVNARFGRGGELEECQNCEGVWAWKRPAAQNGVQPPLVQVKGDIEFQGVSFGYVPGKTVLHGVDMYGRPGQKIAFVGSTGAGKTTITNLINRFYDIQEGAITYDGIPVSEIAKSSLRRSLGIVLQETHLFAGTVMDNIRYGRLEATDEECRAAARLANADGFIQRLPKGYDTVLSDDGGNLSQGQRQLIAIARAAVADPPVLILDEATSSIDTRTEALVARGMDGLMYGRTTFVIAHRLSTVRNSDCILVMEEGRIIERGTHDELLEARGRYYQLYTGKTA